MNLRLLTIALLTLTISTSDARDQVNIVGSSTVYPFATVVAERFGKTTRFKTPKVEATGSGGGLKLFCSGIGPDTPDIANASRRIKPQEIQKCHANVIRDITEAKIGHDGIVLANAKTAAVMKLSLRDIFLALAREVPDPKGTERFVKNPYQTWQEINSSLPTSRIEVLGPPPTSGTRDALAELALEGGCKTYPWIRAIKKEDPSKYTAYCHSVREDGHYIEAGENDNLIVQKLVANPNALGVFGYSFLEQNADQVQGSEIDGVAPVFEAIADGSYPVSRPLYFYIKNAHLDRIPGIREYVTEFLSEAASGADGYLADKGMIPMGEAERRERVPKIRSFTPLQ